MFAGAVSVVTARNRNDPSRLVSDFTAWVQVLSNLWSPLVPSWLLSGEKDPGMLQASSESSIEDLSEVSYSLLKSMGTSWSAEGLSIPEAKHAINRNGAEFDLI